MILIEKSKTKWLVLFKVREKIASMSLEKFFDSLGCVKKDAVWWLFKMKDLVGKESGNTRIWIKDEYTEFTGRLSKPEVKKKVFLRLANAEEDEEEKDSWAKRLGSNSKVFLSFIFDFFL